MKYMPHPYIKRIIQVIKTEIFNAFFRAICLKIKRMKTLAVKPVVALLFAGILCMSAATGVDSFEIYLNNKLLMRHMLTEPLTLKTLRLMEANTNDQLKIVFTQCHAPNKTGKNRKITLMDEQGAVVKEWKFSNSETNNPMVIPVKELLAVQKKNNGKLTLNYTADDYGRQQQLAFI